MKCKVITIAVVLCYATLTASARPKWQAPHGTILVKPGQSLGKLKIGMSPQAVRRIMGQPCRVLNSNAPLVNKRDIWCEKWEKNKAVDIQSVSSYFIIADYVNGKVVQLVANLPSAKMPDGFSMRSSLAEIRKKLKNTEGDHAVPYEDWFSVGFSDRKQGVGYFFGLFDVSISTRGHQTADDAKPLHFVVFKPGRQMVHFLGWW